MMENAKAPIVDAALTRTSGTAERESALAMLGRRRKERWATRGADKAYDEAEFVDALRNRDVTPYIAVAYNVVKLPWLLSEAPRSCPETAKPPPGPAVSRGSNPRPRHRQPTQDSRNGSK